MNRPHHLKSQRHNINTFRTANEDSSFWPGRHQSPQTSNSRSRPVLSFLCSFCGSNCSLQGEWLLHTLALMKTSQKMIVSLLMVVLIDLPIIKFTCQHHISGYVYGVWHLGFFFLLLIEIISIAKLFIIVHFFVLKHEKQTLSYIHTKFEGDKNNVFFFSNLFCGSTRFSASTQRLGLRGWCPCNYLVGIESIVNHSSKDDNTYTLLQFIHRRGNSSLEVCWAHCPAWCSIVGSILLWTNFSKRGNFSFGVNMGFDSIPPKLFTMRV